MRNTALTATPVPGLDDPPNVPLHLGTVADQLETFGVPRFANAADRDTKWPSPPTGAVCMLLDSLTLQKRTSAGWTYVGSRVIGRSTLTANSGAVTAETTLPALAVAFTADPARLYRIAIQTHLQFSVATDRAILNLKDGTTALQGINAYAPAPGANVPIGVSGWGLVQGLTAGAHTLNTTLQRFTGTGNVIMVASPTVPTYVIVEDVGPAL